MTSAEQTAQILAAIDDLRKEVKKLRSEISGKKREKPKSATIISPEWCYEYPEMTIDLTVKQWKEVKSGKVMCLMGRGYELQLDEDADVELEFSQQDYWIFNADRVGGIKIVMGEDVTDGCLDTAFEGLLRDCYIKEHDK